MSRLVHFGPVGDAEDATKYSAGESNTGLPNDYSLHYRRMAAAQTDLRYDVSGGGSGPATNRGITIRRFYIRVWRLPSVETGIWLNGGTVNPAVAALLLTITAAGVVNFYNKGNLAFPGDLIGSPGSVVLGQWHKIEISCGFNTLVWPLNNSGANVLFDGTSVGGTASSNNGIAVLQLGYRDVLGRVESTSPSLDIDYANFVCDDVSVSDSRLSAVKVAALGTFQEWTNAGIAAWQARNTWPGVTVAAGGATTGIQTTIGGQKQTYLLESFAAAGITGTLLGARAHIEFPNAPATVPDLIVIRNGIEVDTATWVQSNNSYLQYRLDTSGWTLSDTIELGVRSSVGTTRIASILLSVEHTTAVPTITIGDIQTVEVSWTGNGTAQTVALPFAPQWILWWPRSAAASGGVWAAEANNDQLIQAAGQCDPNFIVRGTNLYLVGATGGGANSNTVVYDALVVQDPRMRMIGAGAYADVNVAGRDDLAVAMLDPFGGVFTPLTLLAVKEQVALATSYRYYGPGVVGDASTPLNTTSSSAADFIEALTATGFTAGLSLHNEVQQTSFVGFRRSTFTTTFLMDATSYTGNGAGGTRVIPVSLSGLVVKWAIVVPLNATSRILRNAQQSAGKRLQSGGGTVANTIEALGVDSITVGTALNAVGIVYSVLVFGYGTDPPAFMFSGDPCVLTMGSGVDTGGGAGCSAEMGSGADSGGGAGCQVTL